MPRYTLDMVGTDTEIFLRSMETGKPVPAIGLIGGTKHEPKPVPELGKGFFVQEDNVMLEYNIPPAKTKEQFVNNVMKMNSYLQELLSKKGLKADICSSMQFTLAQLKHPQAQHIGCEPDWDVWKRMVNPSLKNNPLMQTIRTSGGHLHISFKVDGKYTDDVFLKEPLVKALDLLNGIPALILDTDSRRRQLYGKPGAFRNKDYGIEYRVLSNFWTTSPERIAWAFEGVQKAIYLLNTNSPLLDLNAGTMLETFQFAQLNSVKASQYIQYLCTRFNMLDRIEGRLPPHAGASSVIDWQI